MTGVVTVDLGNVGGDERRVSIRPARVLRLAIPRGGW